jgi:predicted XRE-type DNA-binding protein
VKKIEFVGRSDDFLRAFPERERLWAAFQLYRLQQGLDAGSNDRPWAGIARRLIRKSRGAQFGVFYVGRGTRHLQVVGAFACFCDAPVERPCFGSGLAGHADDDMTARALYPSVWKAIGDASSTAAELRQRAEIVNRLIGLHRRQALPIASIAGSWGVSQRLLRDLLRGDIARASSDELRQILERAGSPS